jgi:activating signal cointegrator 1
VSGPDFYLPAISVWQPWASLLAHGIKIHETRSWAPSAAYLGRSFAICAAKVTTGLDHYASSVGDGPDHPRTVALRRLFALGVNLDRMPFGAVVGIGTLVEAIRMPPLESEQPGAMERALGDWTPGRWAWRFENMQRLPEPIPVQGKQGIFRLPYDAGAKSFRQVGLSPMDAP